jgi:flagellar basal-body rod modification protein FlgD
MEIQPIGQPLGIPGSQRVEAQRLGQQDFLMLMVEQMRQQNPLEPLDNTDFVAQMAQFDTLTVMNDIAEALLSLASVSELANASALVGRTVTALVPLDADPASGIFREPEQVAGAVERVTFDDNGAVVHIGGRAVPATFIVEVA